MRKAEKAAWIGGAGSLLVLTPSGPQLLILVPLCNLLPLRYPGPGDLLLADGIWQKQWSIMVMIKL